MDLIDIYRIFHPKAAEYTFLSSAHGTFSRIDHMLRHKRSLNKFKKIEIIPSIFSNYNTMRLEINYKKKTCKKHKHMEAKKYATEQPVGHWKKSKRKLKNTWRQMKMETQQPKIYETQPKQF